MVELGVLVKVRKSRGRDRVPPWLGPDVLVGMKAISNAMGFSSWTLRRLLKQSDVTLIRYGRRPVLPVEQVPLLLERFWWADLNWKSATVVACLIKVLQRPELAATLQLRRVRGRRVLRER